jgi:hypothetical protein
VIGSTHRNARWTKPDIRSNGDQCVCCAHPLPSAPQLCAYTCGHFRMPERAQRSVCSRADTCIVRSAPCPVPHMHNTQKYQTAAYFEQCVKLSLPNRSDGAEVERAQPPRAGAPNAREFVQEQQDGQPENGVPHGCRQRTHIQSDGVCCRPKIKETAQLVCCPCNRTASLARVTCYVVAKATGPSTTAATDRPLATAIHDALTSPSSCAHHSHIQPCSL